jgi:hypothetical protein
LTDIFPEEGGWGVAQHGTDTFQRGEVGKGGDVAQAEEGQERGVVALRYCMEGRARCYHVEFIAEAPGAQTAMAVNIIWAVARTAKVRMGWDPGSQR